MIQSFTTMYKHIKGKDGISIKKLTNQYSNAVIKTNAKAHQKTNKQVRTNLKNVFITFKNKDKITKKLGQLEFKITGKFTRLILYLL